MTERVVTLALNRQQWELVDRTVAAGHAPDRLALIRRALAEQARRAGLTPEPTP